MKLVSIEIWCCSGSLQWFGPNIRPTTKQTLTAAESEEDKGKGNTPLPFMFGVACPVNVTLLTEIKWSTFSILSGLRSACRRPSGDESEGGALTRPPRSVTVGQDSSAKLRRSDEGPSRRGRKEEGERDRGAGCHAFLLWAELKHAHQPFVDNLLHRPPCTTVPVAGSHFLRNQLAGCLITPQYLVWDPGCICAPSRTMSHPPLAPLAAFDAILLRTDTLLLRLAFDVPLNLKDLIRVDLDQSPTSLASRLSFG
ncbi:hypothetical protein B0H13DRAFT_2520565 [Mycena leptocephala]|nr:hypothetical protein B0H13DRAFT_2520565 [Mycena leptocephala]